MKKALITGGAGFIGSNFIHFLLKKHNDLRVVNLDKLTYCGNLDNLKSVERNPRYHFIKGDIADKKLVAEIFQQEKPDIVVNFAAATHVDRSIFEPEVFTKTNIIGTQTLLGAALKAKIKKFIQISTDEVYGTIARGCFRERDPFSPNSPYAASKAAADLLARAYYKTFGLPVVVVRSCNNFGPFQFPEKVIPLFITNLLENKKIPLYGEGKNVRDWIYVIDNCSAIDAVISRGAPGEVYNISANQEKTNIELTKIILNFLKKDDTMIEYVSDRPGHDFRYALDAAKIKSLGWQAKYKFMPAVNLTIDWYIKNKKWWRDIKTGEYKNYYKKQYKTL